MNYFKSLNAHKRLASSNRKKAQIVMGNVTPGARKSAIKGIYHMKCFDLIQDKNRKLSRKEKEELFNRAKTIGDWKIENGNWTCGSDYACVFKKKRR